MKFAASFVAGLLLADHASAFIPRSPLQFTGSKSSSQHYMAADMPPPAQDDMPVIQQNSFGQPTELRYSDFLKLVNADRIEKVTFNADGTQLLGVDVDGARVGIEALPNDPDLLTQLSNHKVCTNDRVTNSLSPLYAHCVVSG